ncbi:hypothetical protein AURDEDRAFT_153689 [Auricularia subglabra TFB-10046 SS5]|nr:hypothetical protein AURDEDRAFT_153689 [Auricularia subglabra TFB-10046 SS5]
MLHTKSTRPRKGKQQPVVNGTNGNDETAGMDIDAATDTSEPPNTDTELGRAGLGGLREQHARKRARVEGPEGRPVTPEEAYRWVATVGRLVKGKERFTVELIGEVNAVLDEMEARKNEVVPEILRDGVLDMVRLLAEIQDNVYSLDGLRERAKSLALVWGWMATRRE